MRTALLATAFRTQALRFANLADRQSCCRSAEEFLVYSRFRRNDREFERSVAEYFADHTVVTLARLGDDPPNGGARYRCRTPCPCGCRSVRRSPGGAAFASPSAPWPSTLIWPHRAWTGHSGLFQLFQLCYRRIHRGPGPPGSVPSPTGSGRSGASRMRLKHAVTCSSRAAISALKVPITATSDRDHPVAGVPRDGPLASGTCKSTVILSRNMITSPRSRPSITVLVPRDLAKGLLNELLAKATLP